MPQSDFPYFIARKLRSKEGSSFSALIAKIAIGSVALGIAVMIATSCIFNGFKHTIQEKVFSLVGHVLVQRYVFTNSSEETPPISANQLFREGHELTPDVVHFQQVARKAAILKTKEELAGIMLKGISTDFDSIRFQKNIIAGRLPNRYGKNYAKELMISQKLANKLRLKVNDKATIYFVQDPPKHRNIRISGIYRTSIEELDDLYVIADIRLVQRINNWNDTLVSGFEAFIPDFKRLDQDFDNIEYSLRPELRAEKITEPTQYGSLFDWFTIIGRNSVVLMAVILLVVILNIIAILLIMILERTEMIGTFKALGATDKQIQWVFTLNAIKLVVKGLLIGNGIGIGFAILQQQFHLIPLDPSNYYMDTVPILFNWGEILLYNMVTATIIALITFLPTVFVSRIEPIKAIKFD